MTSGRSVKDNDGKLHRLDVPNGLLSVWKCTISQQKYLLHDFGKSHRLINTRNGEGQVLHHTTHTTGLIGCDHNNQLQLNIIGTTSTFTHRPPSFPSFLSPRTIQTYKIRSSPANFRWGQFPSRTSCRTR